MARISTDTGVRLAMALTRVTRTDGGAAVAALVDFAQAMLLARAAPMKGLGAHVDAQLEELARRLGGE